jgi:hypothetical protein
VTRFGLAVGRCRAGPPPSTAEEALRLLAAAGWDSDAASKLVQREKLERIESDRQRQELADSWA